MRHVSQAGGVYIAAGGVETQEGEHDTHIDTHQIVRGESQGELGVVMCLVSGIFPMKWVSEKTLH